MRRIMIDMHNTLFASAIAKALRDYEPDFEVFVSDTPMTTAETCMDCEANILLMEALPLKQWDLDERIKIRNRVKKRLADCKIVLVVDENENKELAADIRRLKKDGVIDAFIYGSVSAEYLSALIDTV